MSTTLVQSNIVCMFFRENAKGFVFDYIEKKDIGGTTSRRRDTHTHTHTTILTKQLQLGEEVPTATDLNDIRPRSALPPTKNGEASRLGATFIYYHLPVHLHVLYCGNQH
jgi:hypothetical protein